MSSHELMDDAVEERLLRLENQVRTDKMMVAFVAEFSRSDPELINAIFFADYGAHHASQCRANHYVPNRIGL